tara:strand:+ start:1052 stop:1894 length:843 start_codon:yes stop_codon:yes gene_type:complete
MNTLDLINSGSCKLQRQKISTHRLDSEILLSKVLKKKREQILIKLNQKVKKTEISMFNYLIKRRMKKEPIAYIIEEKEFWSKKFKVNKDTLIPRPETELLVENLIKIYKNKKISLLDVGTGTGCILISLLSELSNSNGVGIDISDNAIKTAKKNASLHNLQNRSKFYNKSITKLFNCKFDLLVSNPPYIDNKSIQNLDDGIKKYEPLIALNGGNDGLDVIKKVIYKAKEILKVNGKLALEIGNGQSSKVSRELIKNNFKIEQNIKDYKDNTRCLISTFKN